MPTRKQPAALTRGKRFEVLEKSGWSATTGERLEFERRIVDDRGRGGRLDIFTGPNPPHVVGADLQERLADPGVGIGEIKATDWDQIAIERVRKLALRHTRQVWRYIEAHLGDSAVSAGLIYPREPRSLTKKRIVESVLDEQGIQCVWRLQRKRDR